jgi:hypothetical protein
MDREMANESRIFDSSLLVRHDIGTMSDINAAFIERPQPRAHIASQILIYDQLVIPTHDYGVVAALVNWLGKGIFLDALEVGAFQFVRPQGLLGYVGNGHGVSEYTITEGESARPLRWWQTALFKEPRQAITAQIENLCPRVSSREMPQLVERILPHCSLSHYDNETFMQHIARETYIEIQHSEKLQNIVRAMVGAGEPSIDLQRIPGIAANEVRTGIREDNRDAIDLVLRIAEFHRDLVMATDCSNADLYVPTGAEQLLAQKIARLNLGRSRTEGFSKLLDLNRLPNIGEAVVSGKVNLIDLWRLRQRKEARQFRAWLRNASPEDARDLERLYVSTLSRQSWINSTSARTLRFVITTAAGVVDPIGGFIVGATDSFFVERWLHGYNPKLFLDRYQDLFKPC